MLASIKILYLKREHPDLKKIKGVVLSSTGGAGNDNYFHWMFDVLPRIAIYQKIFDISDIDYFLLQI